MRARLTTVDLINIICKTKIAHERNEKSLDRFVRQVAHK